MADRWRNRSPTFWNPQSSSSRKNVDRKSRREPSMEGSRLPTLRRSRSAASVTRPTFEAKQSTRERSSSTSKNIQPTILFLGSAHKSRPQRSGSSSKFLTPLKQQLALRTSNSGNRLTSNSKTSPWLKQDNKEAQIKEFNRIRQILALTNCNIELVKPVNLRDFVGILIHLFDVLQIDLKLTFVNYITVVPNLMKIICYNGNCTTSFLKTLNTMHNWPHVLGMLSYLCNIVEAQNNESAVIYESGKVKQVFRTTVIKMLQSDANKPEIMCDYVKETLRAKNVNVEEINKAKENTVNIRNGIALLEKNIKDGQVDCETRKTRTMKLESNAEELRKRSEKIEAAHESKMKVIKETIQSREVQHAAQIDKKTLLEEQLKQQTYSKEDVFLLKDKLRDFEETCQLKDEKFKKIESAWNDVFLELSKVNGKLKAAAMRVNAKLTALSVSRPELKKFLMPEEGFSRYTRDTFELVISDLLAVLNGIHDHIGELKQELRQSQADYTKNVDVKKNLLYEITRLQANNNHYLKLQRYTNQEFDDKLQELEKKLWDKRDEIHSLIDDKNVLHADNKEYAELAEKQDKKIVELENIFAANRKSADEALTRTLLNVNTLLKEFQEDILDKIQEQKKKQRIYEELKAELFNKM